MTLAPMRYLVKAIKWLVGLFLVAAVAIAILIYFDDRSKRPTSEIVEGLIGDNLADKETYWFEMSTAFGGWEKVIYVFGYYDNFSACQTLAEYGERTSPGRKFRCERAK